jgi:hypothetical protein
LVAIRPIQDVWSPFSVKLRDHARAPAGGVADVAVEPSSDQAGRSATTR